MTTETETYFRESDTFGWTFHAEKKEKREKQTTSGHNNYYIQGKFQWHCFWKINLPQLHQALIKIKLAKD